MSSLLGMRGEGRVLGSATELAVSAIAVCFFQTRNQDTSQDMPAPSLRQVFSGVLMRGANLSNTKIVGSQMARADAQVRG